MNINLQRLSDKLNVGFVGYCPPTKFDEKKAINLIKQAFDKIEKDFPNIKYFNLVSGVTNVGTLKLAYKEAENRGWSLSGVACKLAENFEWYPGLKKESVILEGEKWGEESRTFTNILDVIVRVGDGPQSLDECNRLKSVGKPTYEYELEKNIEKQVLER